jgi:hypothetical protein
MSVKSVSDDRNIAEQFLIILTFILLVKYREKGSMKC